MLEDRTTGLGKEARRLARVYREHADDIKARHSKVEAQIETMRTLRAQRRGQLAEACDARPVCAGGRLWWRGYAGFLTRWAAAQLLPAPARQRCN